MSHLKGPIHTSARRTGMDINQKDPVCPSSEKTNSRPIFPIVPFCLKNNFIEITMKKIPLTEYNKNNIGQTTYNFRKSLADLILNFNPKALHKTRDKTGFIIKLVIIIEDPNYMDWQKNHPMFPTKTWLQKNGTMQWLSHGITGASIITCTL